MSKDIATVSIRFDKEAKEEGVKAAEKDSRSFNSYVNIALREKVERDKKAEKESR